MKKFNLLVSLGLALVSLASCGSSDENVITVGASSTPHAEILEQCKDALKEKGYTLNIKIFDDYVLPNTALNNGELDANYFQHEPYLKSFNASNGTDLVSAFKVHYEPFGIYSETVNNLDDLAAGATILIPADDSNETRALLLLAQEKLITLKSSASIDNGITTFDIEDSNGYTISPVQADTVPSLLKNAASGTIAVINGNYALEANYKISDALAIEDASGDAATTYANLIACKRGNENSDKIKALIEVLSTQAIKDYITNTYNGAVLPVF